MQLQFCPNLGQCPISIIFSWVSGHTLTEKPHIQILLRRALVRHALGVLLIIVPQGFVSPVTKLELHSPEFHSLNFPEFFSLHGCGLSLATREILLPSKVTYSRRCCSSRWMSLKTSGHVVGVAQQQGPQLLPLLMAAPSASLNPASGIRLVWLPSRSPVSIML